MTEVRGYVLDASLAVKWLIKSDDEPFLEQADRVNRDYQDGLINSGSPRARGTALTSASRAGRSVLHADDRLRTLSEQNRLTRTLWIEDYAAEPR
jgi:hypothetical protein